MENATHPASEESQPVLEPHDESLSQAEAVPAPVEQSGAPESPNEAAGHAKPEPLEEEKEESAGLRVLDAKNVLYSSVFDLNMNDWFTEYDKVQIFNLRMRRNLGTCITSHSYPCRRPVALLLQRSSQQSERRPAPTRSRDPVFGTFRLLQRRNSRATAGRAAVSSYCPSVLPHGR